jgi:hypothetical protein
MALCMLLHDAAIDSLSSNAAAEPLLVTAGSTYTVHVLFAMRGFSLCKSTVGMNTEWTLVEWAVRGANRQSAGIAQHACVASNLGGALL